MTTAAEALIIFVLILINGLLAMSEMAIVSARKARLQQLAEAGDEGAKIALSLANAPSDFLASIQIGITLIGVLAGAYSGATLSDLISVRVPDLMPPLATYAKAIGLVAVSSNRITYLEQSELNKGLSLNNGF